jgi:hypothetical protein
MLKSNGVYMAESSKTFLQKIEYVQELLLCLIRKWWRPLTALGIGATMIVNGVVLPLINSESPDLMGLAALVTSTAAAFAVREWGKVNGQD